MANFHTPAVNPFQVPIDVGASNIKSRYLYNYYNVEFTPARWRRAVDKAINNSDLSELDTLYSYCLQSSPFLVSQLHKRLIPLRKRSFAFEKSNGSIAKDMTEKYINSWWFQDFLKYIELSKFYGVKMFAIDTKTMELTDFPLRNIDIINKGIRQQTYEYYNIVNASQFDNLFYFQPETDQDFKLGLLQPISRAMTGIVEMFVNWQILGKRYSFPLTTIGYNSNDKTAKDTAMKVAENLDLMTTPLLPFRSEYSNSGRSIYSIEVNPIQTQTMTDSFRVMKEYISEYRSEIMQLVTGGTLLGATEKNTNSEQLAEIHMNLYQDILDTDVHDVLRMFNKDEIRGKLARLFKDARFESFRLIEIPDKRVAVNKFCAIGNMMAQQGLQFTNDAFAKVGIEPNDVQMPPETEKKSVLKSILGK